MIIYHIRFVQLVILRDHEGWFRFERRLPFVAILALVIDRREIDSAVEPVFEVALKFCRGEIVPRRGALAMTTCAALLERGVIAGNCSRAEKIFADALLRNELLVKDDARDASGDGQGAGAPPRHAPGMLSLGITKIAFVALGNLFLGAFGRGHDQSSTAVELCSYSYSCSLARDRFESWIDHEHEHEREREYKEGRQIHVAFQ